MKVNKLTLTRTIMLIIAAGNQVIAVAGASSFADNLVYQIASLVFTIFCAIVNWWYNNDFTDIAKIAGAVFEAMKDGKITIEEVNTLLNKPTEEEKKDADK